MSDETPTALWDDNPSTLDLLGFDAVAAPVVDAILSRELDPLTVGIHARWGGGKSTILHQVGATLRLEDRIVVIETNPWEYDDHDDVKGTLIAEVLEALRIKFDGNGSVTDRVKELLGRIAWKRVGKVLAKGAITHSLKLKDLTEALTPKPRDSPETMAGFKDAFAKLVAMLPDTDRVVILVDDLDRCMPAATVATLEAIKLFLSVPGMAFVVAADQDMVRDAIALHLGGSQESSRFAQRYIEKIVQLPVSLPYLPIHEAEAYVGLLLSRASLSTENFEALVAHANARRISSSIPLLAAFEDLAGKPNDDDLRLASQLVQGLRGDRVVNPREIKRFLNAFQVRARIARARGVQVRPDVLVKLLLLEDRFRNDFETLVNTPELERQTLLATWREWALGNADDVPAGVSSDSRDWAAADPDLANEALGPYLTLAAALAITRPMGVPLDAELAALIREMTSSSEALRRKAVEQLMTRPEDEVASAIDVLIDSTRRQADVVGALSSLVEIVRVAPTHAQQVAAGIQESCWTQIDVGVAVDLATFGDGPMRDLAVALETDEGVDPEVRQAARNVLYPEAG